jgi:MFS transporter, DHA2 family, multidrug resistance protein
MWLSNRLLRDPDDFTEERIKAKLEGRMSIDGWGIVLITLASAALEISLDRGQIDDWFGSPLITGMIVIALLGWAATIFWELRNPNPIIDLRLLRHSNFTIACIMFFLFGVSLFGTTALIPQVLQSLYGYRAIDAGLVLAPGALVLTALAPISAHLLQRQLISPKTMVLASSCIVAAAMFWYSDKTLDADSSHYAWNRAMQGFGYGLFLVPANLIAYSQLRPDENNKASSLTNLFRNWGGSFGIAFITTASDRRIDLHQPVLGSSLDSASQALKQGGPSLAAQLIHHGFTSADAGPASLGIIYAQLVRQSLLFAFIDCFRVIGWLYVLAVPIVFAIRKSKAPGEAPAGH